MEELVDGAAALGYPALALTDLENLYGQVRFHDRCRQRRIRAATGLELRPGFDGRRLVGSKAGRVVLLAADHEGYRSLCRIVSRRRGALGKTLKDGILPDPLPLAAQYPEGLFALSDDLSVVEQLVACGRFPINRLGVFLVRPHNPVAETAGRDLAARLGVRLVADSGQRLPEPIRPFAPSPPVSDPAGAAAHGGSGGTRCREPGAMAYVSG